MTEDSNIRERTRMNCLDPLFLQASDNPGILLVLKVFDDHGYNSCRCAMEITLLAKNKLGFANGVCKKPVTNVLNQ